MSEHEQALPYRSTTIKVPTHLSLERAKLLASHLYTSFRMHQQSLGTEITDEAVASSGLEIITTTTPANQPVIEIRSPIEHHQSIASMFGMVLSEMWAPTHDGSMRQLRLSQLSLFIRK